MTPMLHRQEQFASYHSAKIFGVGLSRTGTKSLSLALDILGFTIAHYPIDQITLQNLQADNHQFDILKYVDGITDITVLPFYKRLDQDFLGSKFILTVRDRHSWLTSLHKHWDYDQHLLNTSPLDEDAQRNFTITQLLKQKVFGQLIFEPEHMSAIYQSYYDEITANFQGRPDNLLVLNICDGEGWEKLCPFLGCPIPQQPFPFIISDRDLNHHIQHTYHLPELSSA